MMINRRAGKHGGYIALLSVLIVSAISSAAILILLTTSLSTILNSADVMGGKIAKLNADSCVELVLQRITNGETDPCSSPTEICGTTVNLAQGTCSVIGADGGGANWHIRASGTNDSGNITKYIEVFAAGPNGTAAIIKSRREVEVF